MAHVGFSPVPQGHKALDCDDRSSSMRLVAHALRSIRVICCHESTFPDRGVRIPSQFLLRIFFRVIRTSDRDSVGAPITVPSAFSTQKQVMRKLSATVILLANSKSSNFNGFQSWYPGGTTK